MSPMTFEKKTAAASEAPARSAPNTLRQYSSSTIDKNPKNAMACSRKGNRP